MGFKEVTGEKSDLLYPGRYTYGPAKKPHTAYCHAGEPCILFIALEDPLTRLR